MSADVPEGMNEYDVSVSLLVNAANAEDVVREAIRLIHDSIEGRRQPGQVDVRSTELGGTSSFDVVVHYP